MTEKQVEREDDALEELDGPKLSPAVPQKVLHMWYVEDKKHEFEVKKVSENRSAKALISWNTEHCIITNSVGGTLKVYKTYGEAAEASTLFKIEDKKKRWDLLVKESMILNNQISDLYDQLYKIQGRDTDKQEE